MSDIARRVRSGLARLFGFARRDGEGLSPVAVGLALGLALSLALGGAVRALLFDVAPHDPVTLAGVAAVLVLVAVVACWVPAWRATRMDLVRALRQD